MECRQTSSRSEVKETSHSIMPEIKSTNAFPSYSLTWKSLTSSHSNRRLVTLLAVLRKHQRCSSMRDGKAARAFWLFLASLQSFLERSLIHVVNQVVRPWTQLNIHTRLRILPLISPISRSMSPLCGSCLCESKCEQSSTQLQCW